MFDTYFSLSKDFTGTIVGKWANKSTGEKCVLFGIAAILGTCWGFSKIYFWSVRRKTRQRIQQEREKLRKDKEELYKSLVNDEDLAQVKYKIVNLSFSELRENLRDGKLTAKTILRAYQLKALEVNQDINAIAHVIPDAQKLAEEYDASQKSLLLGGIPVTLKDHYTIKGRYATLGLGSYLFREATEDCVIVKVLKKHGAIPFLITNVPQLLMGVLLSANPIHGQFANPHDPSRIPGGSSSGEGALLAAGGSILGWGSDIGGSIRAPCHFCGVCGFKPTSSRISLAGSPDFFEGVNLIETSFGPMSRDVDGLVQAMRALWNGYMFDLDPSVVPMTFDEEEYSSKKSLRIGYYIDVEGLAKISPPCKRAVLMAKQRVESLGHQVVRWDFPGYIEKNNLFGRCLLSNDNLDETKTLLSESEVDEALGFFSQTGRYRILHRIKAVLQTAVSIISGGLIPLEKDKGSIAEWWSLATEITKHREEVHGAWKRAGLDAVICPTIPIPAYKIQDRHLGLICFPFYGINNLFNMPTGVVPITHVNQDDLNALNDLDDNDLGVKEIKQAMDPGSVGLPVTVQVAALTFRDELCLRVMKEIEDLKIH